MDKFKWWLYWGTFFSVLLAICLTAKFCLDIRAIEQEKRPIVLAAIPKVTPALPMKAPFGAWCYPEIRFEKSTTLTCISGSNSAFAGKKMRVCALINGGPVELGRSVVADKDGKFILSVAKRTIKKDVRIIVQCDDIAAQFPEMNDLLIECTNAEGVHFKMKDTSVGAKQKGIFLSIDTPE